MKSFSNEVRDELARYTGKDRCCQLAELMALLQMGGTLVIVTGGIGINFITENASVARKVFSLNKLCFNIVSEIMVSRSRKLRKKNTYQIRIPPHNTVNNLLDVYGISNKGRVENADLLRKNCCKRSYIRGAFLGGGSVNKPEANYHLELVANNNKFAANIVRTLKGLGIEAKSTIKNSDNYIVYLKSFEKISDFLRVCGANDAVLKLESARVTKEIRGKVNRLINCETANTSRALSAAYRQYEKINKLVNKGKLNELPLDLKKVAELRIKYPEATLNELVSFCDEKIGKSLISYKLKKIEQIADNI